MSEIINLASFEFDLSKTNKNIDELTGRLFELTKVQKANRDEAALLAKEYSLLKTAGGDNAKALGEVKDKQLAVFKAMQQTATQTSVVRGELNQLTAIQKARLNVEGQELSLMKAIDAARSKEITNINEARAQISALTKLRNQLNPAIEEEAKLIGELNDQIDANTSYVKENTSAMERQKMNIGNYQESVEAALGSVDLFNGGIGGFIQKSQEAGGAGNLLATSAKGVASGFLGMAKAGLAFIATPVGAIIAALVLAFLAIKTAMDRSEAATNKLKVAFSAFGGIITMVMKAIEPLGEFLIDGLVAGFELAGQAAEEALSIIADGLEFLGLDEAAGNMRNFTAEVKAGIKDAQKLAEAEIALEQAQRKSRLTQLEYQKAAEKLRQIRDDEGKSIPQRIAANEQLGRVLKKQLEAELAIAKQALVVANLRIKADGATKATIDAQYAALTEIADIQERITGQESEQLANRVALQKEANEKAIEATKKRQDAELKRMAEELDFFLQSQGFKSKALEEELKIEREAAAKKRAILDAELKYGKISRLKYNTEILALTNELGKKTAELTIDNAQLELEEYIRLQNEKYEVNQRLNETLVTQEEARLADQLDKQQDFAALELEQGIINKTEFNAQMLLLDEEYETKKEELRKGFEIIKAEDLAEKRALETEAELLRLESDSWGKFEAEKIIEDAQFEEKKTKLAEQRAQGLINEENYQLALDNINKEHAKANEEIERLKNEYKLQVASQTAGNLAKIAGEETAAGKAFAIAQTTIDTYQSATSAYKSLSGIPIVGPILGAVAAAAAVVAGISNVKKITAVKTPKGGGGGGVQGLATGGEVRGGFAIQRANGDDRLITAKTGEVILNASQRSYIGDSVLGAAGVPGFATGGVVGPASIAAGSASLQNLDNGAMAQAIAAAVEQGAARGSAAGSAAGSAKGMKDLADTRSIQNLASF